MHLSLFDRADIKSKRAKEMEEGGGERRARKCLLGFADKRSLSLLSPPPSSISFALIAVSARPNSEERTKLLTEAKVLLLKLLYRSDSHQPHVVLLYLSSAMFTVFKNE